MPPPLNQPRRLARSTSSGRPASADRRDRHPSACMRHRRSTARRQAPAATRAATSTPTHRRRTAPPRPLSAARTASSPCTSRVTSRASSRCAWRFSGSRALARLELRDPRGIEEREEAQVPHRVAVVGVQPELIELVRRRQRRIEPDGARLRLAELRARRRRDERHHQTVRLAAAHAPDQIHPGGDVAPLIAAAHLQRAAEAIDAARDSRTPAAASS